MDPLTLDILWARLIALTDEQAAALMRSSFTSIVREAGDLAAGVFDRRGRMIAQSVTGTPGHINSMATGLAHLTTRFPPETLDEGDVLVTNDPWLTAGQLNDITIATPVFRDGRVVALFASCCHALDIGGRGLSADSRSVFEEGVALPMMKLYEAGRPVGAIFDILAANSRAPEAVLGDLHSQIVANEVAGRRLLAFMDEFALDDLETLSDEIVDRTEAATRAAVAALPDGVHEARMAVDGFDGMPVEIRARVTIAGDALTVDFDGTTPQLPIGVNVALNYTRAYATYGVKCALSPEIPNNEGVFRAIRIDAPAGCVLNAQRPAPVGGRHLVGHFLPSVVMQALAGVAPDAVAAPGADALWDTHLAGTDRAGRGFSFTWFASGGVGAMQGRDGLSATAYPSGIAGVPVEVMERLAPIVLHERSLAPDTGGAGRWRGGLGQRMTVEVLTDAPYLFSSLYERARTPAPGLFGGLPGATGVFTVTGDATPPPKTTVTLAPGATFALSLPGGGGYGDPALRPAERVAEDVAEGYVTEAEARRLYPAYAAAHGGA